MKHLAKRPARTLDPFDMGSFEEWMRSFFDGNGLTAPVEAPLARMPRADLAETEGEYRLSIELPGMEEKDIDVQIRGDHLVVSGERKQRTEKKDERLHRVECSYGAFERAFELPRNVRREPDAISATFDKGMLEIRVPKVEPTPQAKIPVKAGKR